MDRRWYIEHEDGTEWSYWELCHVTQKRYHGADYRQAVIDQWGNLSILAWDYQLNPPHEYPFGPHPDMVAVWDE